MPSALHILPPFIFKNPLGRYYYNCCFPSEEVKKQKHKKVKDLTNITRLTHGRAEIQTQAAIPEHILLTMILCFPQHGTGGAHTISADKLLSS